MTTEQLWEQFFFNLRVQRRFAGTLSFYQVSRQKLAAFLTLQAYPQEGPGLTVTHLRSFVLWLAEHGLNPGGQHAHVRAEGRGAVCKGAMARTQASRGIWPSAYWTSPTRTGATAGTRDGLEASDNMGDLLG